MPSLKQGAKEMEPDIWRKGGFGKAYNSIRVHLDGHLTRLCPGQDVEHFRYLSSLPPVAIPSRVTAILTSNTTASLVISELHVSEIACVLWFQLLSGVIMSVRFIHSFITLSCSPCGYTTRPTSPSVGGGLNCSQLLTIRLL